jgi:hypothetical protein
MALPVSIGSSEGDKENRTMWRQMMGKSLIIFTLALLALPLMGHSGCRIHSPAQEELAKDVRSRYEKITPSALDALENLDADLEKLIESERADFEIIKETSENRLLDITWATFRNDVESLRIAFHQKDLGLATKLQKGVDEENKTVTNLAAQTKTLTGTVSKLDEAIEKTEKRKTLAESLEEAKIIVNQTIAALNDAVAKNAGTPVSERLSGAIGQINKLVQDLDKLENDSKNSDRVFSLIIEAMRLGRDIAALELEAVQQEQKLHKQLLKSFQTAQKLVPTEASLILIRDKYTVVGVDDSYQYPTDEKIRIRMALLAQGSAASEERRREALTSILRDLATVQSLTLTNEKRLKELELRRSAEAYRNARLKDAIYERQRMTLISYGLEGIVRYSESGWRAEDINSLINIARLVAEIVIATRV